MTATLTASYAGCVLLVLAAAAGYLYLELARSIAADSRELLQHKVQVLTRLVQQSPVNRQGIEQEAEEEAELSEDSAEPFLLRVLQPDDRVLVETPGMAVQLPPASFPAAGAGQPSLLPWRTADGRHYLLAASAAGGGWRIHAAVGTEAGERLLARNRRAIAVVLVAALLISAPLAAWVTRRGLRPVAEIAGAVGDIGATQLHLRVDARRWPQELSALAGAFDAMLARLQESFERLRQFSADIAHELRTPINNLLGETQVALGRPREADEYQRVLQSAIEEYERLARMIDSMLFIAQAEQGRLALERWPLDARAELEQVAGFYQALADEAGVELTCSGSASLVADPLLLRRALVNLLSNALRYTGRGGHVRLSVGRAGEGVRFVVADDGQGIDATHLPHLGDRFYRADASRSGSSEGAGLGLSIVRSIVQLHGGTMRIDSAQGAGTTVVLTLPAEAGAA